MIPFAVFWKSTSNGPSTTYCNILIITMKSTLASTKSDLHHRFVIEYKKTRGKQTSRDCLGGDRTVAKNNNI